MTKQDLKNLIATEMSLDVSSPQVEAWVETARQMVLGADGKKVWQSLIVNTTLALTADEDEYVFPPDGSNDEPLFKLLLVEKQGAEDVPIRIYNEEEWAHTDFTDELTGLIIRPHAEPGKVKFVFADAPSSAVTVNVVYERVPGDDLDFVKPQSHDVFIFALRLIVPPKGVSLSEASAIRQSNYLMYKDRLAAAIANDYTAHDEPNYFVPASNVQNFMNDTITISGNR